VVGRVAVEAVESIATRLAKIDRFARMPSVEPEPTSEASSKTGGDATPAEESPKAAEESPGGVGEATPGDSPPEPAPEASSANPTPNGARSEPSDAAGR